MEAVSKLAVYRRKKGLTQEQLAELSGVTTRTIQRIEKGAVVPHIQTLKMLADSLEIETELLMDKPEGNRDNLVSSTGTPEKMDLAPLFHLLALGGLFLPGLNVILPFILWILKKEEALRYDQQGRKTLNFNITYTIILYLATAIMVLYYPVGFPLLILCYFYMVVMSIVNLYYSVKLIPVRYPLSIPFMTIKD